MLIGIKRNDGGVSVMNAPDGSTEDFIKAEIAKWERSTKFSATSWSEIDAPPPREFRNAYELNGKSVVLNMEKARDLHKAELRLARAPMLQALDTEYMRADEAGDDAEKLRIAKRKQALRDVTKDPRIASAKSPADLLAVTLP